tara:strand:+ start:36953 stop:37336 length:384 start_codon:yes stop_codon:yes gene_type:complete
MKDLITFVPDLRAMVAEAIAIQDDEESTLARYFTVNEDGVSFDVSKVPVVRTTNNQSVCLVRGISRSVIESSTTIKVIGEVVGGEYVFDEGGQAIYESIYDTKPRMIDDGEGGQVEYTPPYKIGGFC